MILAASAIIIGGIFFVLLLTVVFGIMMLEFSGLVARRGHRAFDWLLLAWTLAAVFSAWRPGLGIGEPLSALLLLTTMGWAVIRYRQGTENAFTGFAMTMAAAIYIGWGGAHIIRLRMLPDGLYWTLVMCVAVWGADTFAYFVGIGLGKTPLIPDISPNKTWEGYIGGVLSATALTAASMPLWAALGAGPSFTVEQGLIIGLLLSILSPVGDFAISMLKRYAGAKDASHLIPGHGGLLDRLDALLVGGILLYTYVTLLGLAR